MKGGFIVGVNDRSENVSFRANGDTLDAINVIGKHVTSRAGDFFSITRSDVVAWAVRETAERIRRGDYDDKQNEPIVVEKAPRKGRTK